ncbi:unnamed protein product [Durusdinium trenchii]|uniref:Uncharacterized protein n=1 Tax=Durusdinium trenchii TaxID=1381693 RepID=A0ABP0PRC3_9DINO
MVQVKVKKAIFFDVSELQLQYGQLLLHLIQLHPTREALVEALYGRSMARFGRVLCASNMMDFLNEAPAAEPEIQTRERLPEQLQELYRSVFRCISRPSSWPVVWPCFGRSSSLPQRRMAPVSLSKAQRRLGGHRNEAFHINEAGWLKSDETFQQLRSCILELQKRNCLEFRHLNFRDIPKVGEQRVIFISNIDGSPQFLADDQLGAWRREAHGTLLLSTRGAEWLP